jgi:endo-1,4-beta-xylanase
MRRSIPMIAAALLLVAWACGGRPAPTSPTSPPPPGGTEVPALRDAARTAGKRVGTAVQTGLLRDARYSAVLARHFNDLTAEYEMKWDPIEHVQGTSDFSAGDAIVAYGQSNGMEIKGHALIWHRSLPPWIDGLSVPELRAAFERHIRSVAEHYRGRVRTWDVVNEAIADDGTGLRNTVFREKLGDD